MIILAIGTTPTSMPHASALQIANEKPQLDVSIDELSPSHLSSGDTLEMSGTVTNNNKHDWDEAQAYLVISKSPFTSRSQLSTAVENNQTYTGERIVDLSTIDDIGTLEAGKTTRFDLKVPWNKLELTGADGVYPVGVQILGTDSEGERSNDPIGKATTFLPKLDEHDAKINMSVLWPFRLSDHRTQSGDWHNPDELLKQIAPGGRLSRLLHMAEDSTGQSTMLLDPALLAALDDIAHKRHLSDDATVTDGDAKDAGRYRDSLITLARKTSLWVTGFDRPDTQSIADQEQLSGRLMDLVNRSTEQVLDQFGLSGRRAIWPADGALNTAGAELVRGSGDQPIIMSSEHLDGWASRSGSVVRAPTGRGPVPIIVNDGLFDRVPGGDSVVALRQWMGAQSALAALQQAIDPDSRADVVAFVPPTWTPSGNETSSDLADAFTMPWVDSATLDSILQAGSLEEVSLRDKANGRLLPPALLQSVFDLSEYARRLAELTGNTDETDGKDASLALQTYRLAVSGLSTDWRDEPDNGARVIKTATERAAKEFSKITIEGPQSVTLSSDKGQFPLTVRNDTTESITVGLSLEASNPVIRPPHVKDIEIEAGQRHTYTVDLDLGSQASSSLTVRLTTSSGTTFGKPAVFNVRSSDVGTIVWVSLAGAGLLVVVAMARRFTRRGREPSDD